MKRSRLLYALLALALIIPSTVRATGSLSIPNTIAAQSGPTLQASLLDSNWAAIATYVNARELTQGTLAARPVAGVSGRYYFATDQNGGITYVDTGSAWTQITPPVNSVASGYSVRGLMGATSTATNSQFNVTATRVVLTSPTDNAPVVRTATTTLTNNILTAGPAANARDQAAAFGANVWVHFYYIWNSSTLATLSSLCAPESVGSLCSASSGPNLPATYTHWAYIGAIRTTTSGVLFAAYARDGKMFSGQVRRPINAVAITASDTQVNLSTFIPPNALGFSMGCTSATTTNLIFSVKLGESIQATSVGGVAPTGITVALPNVDQNMFFVGGGTSSTLLCDLQYYDAPNGG